MRSSHRIEPAPNSKHKVSKSSRCRSTHRHRPPALRRSGYLSYLEVLDAERGLFQAQLQYAQTQQKLLQAMIDLYKAMGGGWPGRDVNHIDHWGVAPERGAEGQRRAPIARRSAPVQEAA